MVLDNPVSTTKKDFYYKGNLPMDPGTTYIVEWDYLPTTDAEFRLWAGNLGLSLGASSGNGTEWKHGSKIFTTPTSMVDINNAKYKGWVFAVVSDIEGASQAIVDNITIKLYNSGVKAESIKLTQDKLTMMPGRTENLGIMATPANGDVNKSIWTSSDENVATVEYGIVTAVGKGTATITATTRDGVSASCEVTVSGNPAFITNGTFDDATDNTWGMTGGTAIENGIGTLGSKAASIAADGTLTYEIKDLQPETTYQFFIRHRSPANGKLKMTLVNGEEDLLKGKTVGTSASWAKETYEFTTGTTVADTYKLTLAPTDGTGPIYVDNILLTQKATLIDFVVESLVWTDGEQVKPGTELLFAVFISNIGKDPVKAGSTINIDICMDSKPIQTLTYTFETEFAAGAITDAPIMSTEPWAAVKGDHVISARVNSTLSVLESNTDNNNMVQSDLRVYDEILEVPELAEQAGFTTLDFSDDFNSLDTIDMGATGADGYKWYVTRPYGSTSLTTEDYSIDDGILTMKNVIPTYNMGFSSADCKTGRGYAFNQGYLEYRIRIPRPRENTKGEDGIPAVWSLPLDKLMSVRGSDWVEMDWMEYWGFDGGKKPEGYYTITLHDQGTDENDVQTWYNKNKNYSKRGLGDGEWHTMAFLWVQDLLLGYLDGEEVFRLAYDENSFSDPMQSTIVPDERGGLGAFSYMNIQELVLHIGGSKDNPLEMDYIRVWTSVGGSEFTPDLGGDDDEELGDGDFIVDIPAMDFWENYCTDDWGDPITVIDEYNYEYILMGGEYWSYLSDERKAEINALLAANGQPTFEELLAMAQAFANGEEPPATGVTTALPAVASAMLISAAGLWVSRKRKK
ncbi:MAG: Ig-like domain-containing protein [Clostridia bacterium]|nr:Ig-like domain-containing protein [Clostridia bacterium]